MSNRKIDLIPKKRLTPQSTNSRTHSKKQIQQIANSIEQFGFTKPVPGPQSSPSEKCMYGKNGEFLSTLTTWLCGSTSAHHRYRLPV